MDLPESKQATVIARGTTNPALLTKVIAHQDAKKLGRIEAIARSTIPKPHNPDCHGAQEKKVCHWWYCNFQR